LESDGWTHAGGQRWGQKEKSNNLVILFNILGRVIRSSSSASPRQLPKNYGQYLLYRIRKLRSDFVAIYSVGHIRKWSLWWAMTTCMSLQVEKHNHINFSIHDNFFDSLQVALFSQTLWGEVQVGEGGENKLNGFAEAGYTATGEPIGSGIQ
jgi:hypothetical protein